MKGRLRWLGLAFFEFISASGKIILFDPFTKTDGNDLCPHETGYFKKADLILVSHDHFDHINSAVSLSKQTGAIIGGPDESVKRLIREEGADPSKVVNDGNGYIVGGGTVLPWAKITATPALHSSNTGVAIGTIITLDDGTTIYHTGDTALTGDMEIYSRLYNVEVLMLPILGRCMMDVAQAVEAVKIIKPKVVIPMHFDGPKHLDDYASPGELLDDFVSSCRNATKGAKVIKTEKDVYYDL